MQVHICAKYESSNRNRDGQRWKEGGGEGQRDIDREMEETDRQTGREGREREGEGGTERERATYT